MSRCHVPRPDRLASPGELHRRIVKARTARGVAEIPAYDTVYRCLQPGRSRLDVELVVDVVRALLADEPDEQAVRAWRQAYQLVTGAASDAAVVNVTHRLPDDLDVFTGRADVLQRLERSVFEALGALGAIEPARARLDLALVIAREVASRDAEALALNESARCTTWPDHPRPGSTSIARPWRSRRSWALVLFDRLQTPEADTVATHLAALSA